jgi:hypothetical protein
MAFSSQRNRRRRPSVHRSIKGLVAVPRAEIRICTYKQARNCREDTKNTHRQMRTFVSSTPPFEVLSPAAVAMTNISMSCSNGIQGRLSQAIKPESALSSSLRSSTSCAGGNLKPPSRSLHPHHAMAAERGAGRNSAPKRPPSSPALLSSALLTPGSGFWLQPMRGTLFFAAWALIFSRPDFVH